MKNTFILLTLLWFTGFAGYSQTLPQCPSGNGSVVGFNAPVKEQYTPPANPPGPGDPPVFSKDRLVFWVHGLGGNIDSWARAAQATQYQSPGQQIPGYPARKVTSVPVSYSQFSLSGAASTLHNLITSQGDPLCTVNQITDKTINFVIGHSQGGIVARATDMMYANLGDQIERRFGGIVTFASAHGGAQIINNKDQLAVMGGEACTALSAGPLDDAVQSHPIVDFFINDETFESFNNGMCSFLEQYIIPISFKDEFQEITEDYKVGAAALAELNAYNSDIPKVAFYGEEEEPVFYRTIYTLKVKQPNSFPPFQADPDDDLVNRFNDMLNLYKAKYEKYDAQVQALELAGLPCGPLDWITKPNFCAQNDMLYWIALRKRDKWQAGYYWLLHSNNKFKTITGALETHWITTYTCNCNGASFPTNQPSCPPGCTLSGEQSYLSLLDHPNDGVVLAASAAALPGAMSARMPGSNHQQIRNDSNTKSKLYELFEGAYGDYFATSTR